jgi:sulfate/thiosulfate transport system permease protein
MSPRRTRLILRFIALGYLALLIVLPLGLVLWRTFEHGLGPVWEAATRPAALHALKLTTLIVLVVVPLNTVFGVLCALTLVRRRFPGQALLGALAALPLAVSPVVVGLALILVYGRRNPIGGWLWERDVQVIFALPGMILATIFVSLPFVVREIVPVLREIGTDQEQAAGTLGASGWQTFRLITLPAIRSGIVFGVVLTTSRALGEYGAVSIVSGKLSGRTETLTLHVEERFQAFDLTGAYVAAVEMALLALLTLVAMHTLKRAEGRK